MTVSGLEMVDARIRHKRFGEFEGAAYDMPGIDADRNEAILGDGRHGAVRVDGPEPSLAASPPPRRLPPDLVGSEDPAPSHSGAGTSAGCVRRCR